MTDQLSAYYPTASLSTIYFVVMRPGTAWNGTAFESLVAAHWSTYVIAGADAAGVGLYLATMPSAISPGVVSAYAYRQLGGSPAPTDTLIGSQLDASWDGTGFAPDPMASVGAIVPGQTGYRTLADMRAVLIGTDVVTAGQGGTRTVVYKNPDGSTAETVTIDASGNRTASTEGP